MGNVLFSFPGLGPIDVDFPRLQLRGSAIEESHDLDAWCLFEMAKKIMESLLKKAGRIGKKGEKRLNYESWS